MTRKRDTLRNEVVVVLIAKMALLFIFWFFCFSHSVEATLTTQNIFIHLMH